MLRRKTNISKLYWVYTLFHIAKSLVSILGPIYLYRLDYPLQTIILYFIITALFKVGALPIVFKCVAKYGAKYTTGAGIVVMIAHFICFATLEHFGTPLVVLAGTLGIANAFFYPSFRVCFSLVTEHAKTGSQVAKLNTLTLLFGAAAPVLGGIVAALFDISLVYYLATTVFLAAFALLFFAKNIATPKFSLSHIPRGDAIRDYVSNASYSTSGLADLFVWPLLISFIIPSYAGIGAYAGFIIVVAAVIQLWSGAMGDKKGEKGFLVTGAIVGVLYNILRILATTITHLVSLSIVGAISSSLLASSYGGRFYKNIDKRNHLEYLFAMEVANSVTWLIYFPILFTASHFLSVEDTLRAGVILVAPAVLGMMFVRFHAKATKLEETETLTP